jgi:hypothetical protein
MDFKNNILKDISQHEWDYRDLHGDNREVSLATLYEYTRSESSISAMYVKWLDSPISDDRHEICSKHFTVKGGATTPRDLLKQIEETSSPLSQLGEEASSFHLPVYLTLPKMLLNYRMSDHLLLMVDFPAPYMEIRERPGFSKMRSLHYAQLTAAKEGIVWGSKVGNWNFLNFGNPSVEDVTLGIDWGKSDRNLIDSFRDWLKENRKSKAADRRKKYPGYALKCLAAYKLQKHYKMLGEDASDITNDIIWRFDGEKAKPDTANKLIPLFEEHNQINRAVADYYKYSGRLLSQ